MKKLVLTLIMLIAFAPFGFAAEVTNAPLSKNIKDFKLSTNVDGQYSTNASNSEYIVTTAHKQGDMVYASGSIVSGLYEKSYDGDLASDDLATGTTYDSTAFNTNWKMK
ncbi:MAG: hypothetical protein PHH87_03975 [Desulfuromonas sp.]|nr:hypothetical protein [Desulfuromonas sp.]